MQQRNRTPVGRSEPCDPARATPLGHDRRHEEERADGEVRAAPDTTVEHRRPPRGRLKSPEGSFRAQRQIGRECGKVATGGPACAIFTPQAGHPPAPFPLTSGTPRPKTNALAKNNPWECRKQGPLPVLEERHHRLPHPAPVPHLSPSGQPDAIRAPAGHVNAGHGRRAPAAIITQRIESAASGEKQC